MGGWANMVRIKEEVDDGRREWTMMDREYKCYPSGQSHLHLVGESGGSDCWIMVT